jgi:plastocyanin
MEFSVNTMLLSVMAVAVLACTSNPTGTGNTPLPPAPGTNVSIVSGASAKGVRAYSPDTIRVSRSTPGALIWHNRDNSLHSLTGQFFEGFDSPVAPGDSLAVPIQSGWFPGSYEYHCSIHSTMVGRVIITP